MDIDIPGVLLGQQRRILEEELGDVFQACLAETRGARDTVVEIYNVCHQRMEALRLEAADQLHRPARHMALQAQAEEMEAQAATWQLLFCLYCDEAAPAGEGGPKLEDAWNAPLYRQRLADRVLNDKELARCARVVSWLESLAEESVKRQGQGQAGFALGEGLWHETKTEMRAGTGSVVSELDPDAPGRCGRPLHPSNARSQERILARVWQLMRAGRLPAALELCQFVGQPWRAAALGGGGPYGSLPVGTTAAEQDEELGTDLQAEELADEVSSGSGTLLALWRWTALQAAAAPPGDKFERAVFGALGGSTAATAPACATWEDFAWSYCRSWLESQLSRAVPPEAHAPSDLVGGDVVAAALARCGVPPAAAQRSVEAAMSVVLGTASSTTAAPAYDSSDMGAPAAASAAETAGPAASRGFGQLFAQHVMTAGSLVNSGPPAVQVLRQVQGLLVQGDMQALANYLWALLVERHGGAPGGGAAGNGDEAAPAYSALEEAAIGGGAAAAAAAAAVSSAHPDRRWRTCALATHMLLALEGLGVLSGGGGGGGGAAAKGAEQAGDADLYDMHRVSRIQDLCQRLLLYYVGSLLERGLPALVPPYLCVLRPALRSMVCQELLAFHTRRLTGVEAVAAAATAGPGGKAGEDAGSRAAAAAATADDQCYGAYVALDEWFRRCLERQQQSAEVLASRLVTDISPDELRLQLKQFAESCRENRAYGPHQRARVARWLAYPYIATAEAAAAREEQRRQAAAAAADGGVEDVDVEAAAAVVHVDPRSYQDLLQYANGLCCELALGDDVTASAGHLLFEEVLPEDLDLSALSTAEALADFAAAAAAELEAAAAADAAGPLGLVRRQAQQQAAEEVAADLRLAPQLRDLASELSCWRLFFRLDAQLARWTARHSALEAAAAAGAESPEELEALVRDGSALLQAYLSELLQTGWQVGLATADRALAAAAEGDGVVRATMTVVAPPGSGSLVPSTGSAWGQPTAPYPELQGTALLEFKLAVEEGLKRAAAAVGLQRGAAVDVRMEVPPDPADAVAGHAIVSLAAAADTRSWHALVGLLCGAVRGGLEGVPPLLLVGLQADRATSLAVARRCCIGQAVLRCAGLRLSLVALGADAESPATGPQLLEMLAEPPETPGVAQGSGGLGLLDLLTPAQLQHVLTVEADTVVQHLRNRQQRQMAELGRRRFWG